jgi:hypothetical protein
MGVAMALDYRATFYLNAYTFSSVSNVLVDGDDSIFDILVTLMK